MVTLSALILKITKSKPSLPAKIIIFFSNCDSVDFFFDLFTNSFKSKDSISAPFSSKIDGELNQNVNVFKLHGNILHNDRIRTFKSFSKSQAIENSINSSILFCTDVAARGLDFPDATHIIQYGIFENSYDFNFIKIHHPILGIMYIELAEPVAWGVKVQAICSYYHQK